MLRIFFKKISIRDAQYLPANQPVLLVSNHSNAFMDAMVVSCFTPQHTYYLARGDVFKRSFARWLLNKIKIYPIYRQQEGMENVSKNDETFALCNKLLAERKTIIIYPEGICVQERRLRKLKKGAARIAFGAEEMLDFNLGVQVVPVGINYSDPKKFRSEVYLKYGPAIHVSDFAEAYRSNKALAINQLTSAIEKALENLLVVIPHPANDQLIASLEEIDLNERKVAPGYVYDAESEFQRSRSISKAVSQIETTHGAEIEWWRNTVRNYEREVKAAGLRDHLLQESHIKRLNAGFFAKDLFLLLFGIPVHLLGLTFNYLPYKCTSVFAQKKVKHVEFLSSMYIGFAFLLYPLWYTLQAIVIWSIVQNVWSVLVYLLLLPLFILYNVHFYPLYLKIKGRRKLVKLMAEQKEKLIKLCKTRSSIVEWMNGIMLKDTN